MERGVPEEHMGSLVRREGTPETVGQVGGQSVVHTEEMRIPARNVAEGQELARLGRKDLGASRTWLSVVCRGFQSQDDLRD